MRDLIDASAASATHPGTATQDLAARVLAWCQDVVQGARRVTPSERDALARCAAAIAASDRGPPHATIR